MIDPNDPFILTQSEQLLQRVDSEAMHDVLASGSTSELPLKMAMIASERLAKMCTLAVAQKTMDSIELDNLKDENAELRKRLLPDAMPEESDWTAEYPNFAAILAVSFYTFALFGLYHFVRIFI